MSTSVMWKTPEARAQMQQWHRRFAARLPAGVVAKTVTTSWGETQVLVGGPIDGPPLLLFHGALASSAHVLVELAGLLEHHRVYAVDVIGQSAMAADARLDVNDDSHGHFVVEVADALRGDGLERPRVDDRRERPLRPRGVARESHHLVAARAERRDQRPAHEARGSDDSHSH